MQTSLGRNRLIIPYFIYFIKVYLHIVKPGPLFLHQLSQRHGQPRVNQLSRQYIPFMMNQFPPPNKFLWKNNSPLNFHIELLSDKTKYVFNKIYSSKTTLPPTLIYFYKISLRSLKNMLLDYKLCVCLAFLFLVLVPDFTPNTGHCTPKSLCSSPNGLIFTPNY